MRRPHILPAFSAEEQRRAHTLLAVRVVHMMGRKLEEGDWTQAYCRAKGIPFQGWSNLHLDVVHGLLGIEHKMLCYRSSVDLQDACGRTWMHPAATRSIRVPTGVDQPNEVMRILLEQYGEWLGARAERVRQQAGGGTPDVRTGWLLWQTSLRQFLYFEEEALIPDPGDFYAEWNERRGRIRKSSRNLWIYERETGRKRYSITMEAGAKIQPYFDVPPPDDPNLYLFTVIGEFVDGGLVRLWVADSTAAELERILGNLESEVLSRAVIRASMERAKLGPVEAGEEETAKPLFLIQEAYEALCRTFPGVNDDHSFRLLLLHLRGAR